MTTKPASNLYFAFPDAVYDYVCAECTALCCRGHGMGGSLRREMGSLLTLYPALAPTITSRAGDVLHFGTPPAGCFFLDPDNLCRIEKEHGRGLKPGVCALFPFSQLTLIGTAVAVSPHFLCPLVLRVPARPGRVGGTHAILEAAVRESGLLDEQHLGSHGTTVLHASEDALSTLKREESFRDLCAESLGRSRFAEAVSSASAEPALLSRFVDRAADLMRLQASDQPERDLMDDVLLALAPPLRLGLLSLTAESVLRVLALAERVARRALSLSRAEPTLQTVHNAISAVIPALRLLAHGDAPLDVAVRDMKMPGLGPAIAFAGYLALREAPGPAGTMAALEKAIEPSMSEADRWILLNHLGGVVASRPGRLARGGTRPRGAGAAGGKE